MTVQVLFPEAVPPATLNAPDTAPAGSTITVEWTGPAESYDNIQIVLPGEVRSNAMTYVDQGNPLTIVAPAVPGVYEIRYMWKDAEPIAVRSITLTEPELALIAPDTAPGGSTVAVEWRGPNQPYDNIQVGLPASRAMRLSLYHRWQPGDAGHALGAGHL